MAKHGTQHLFIIRNEQGCWIFKPNKLHYQFEKGRFLMREDEGVINGRGPEQFVKVADRCRMKVKKEWVVRLDIFDIDIKRKLRRGSKVTVRPLLIDLTGELEKVTGLIPFDKLDDTLRDQVALPKYPAEVA